MKDSSLASMKRGLKVSWSPPYPALTAEASMKRGLKVLASSTNSGFISKPASMKRGLKVRSREEPLSPAPGGPQWKEDWKCFNAFNSNSFLRLLPQWKEDWKMVPQQRYRCMKPEGLNEKRIERNLVVSWLWYNSTSLNEKRIERTKAK